MADHTDRNRLRRICCGEMLSSSVFEALMFSVILFAVAAFGMLILLKPSATVNAIQFRIPPEARTIGKGTVPVGIAVIFVFSYLGFDSVRPAWRGGLVNMSDPAQKMFTLACGIFILLFGIFACIRPPRFTAIASPRLKQMNADSIDAGSLARIELVSRFWGILLLLASAFLLQQFGS